MRVIVLLALPMYLLLGTLGYWDEETPFATTIEEVYTPDRQDVEKLARLINAEAGGESYLCKVYVANVVVNRMMWFGETLERVISKPRQFSGYNNKRYNSDFSQEEHYIAQQVLSGKLHKLPYNTLYFCNPKTSTNKKFVAFCQKNLLFDCGNHIFALEK